MSEYVTTPGATAREGELLHLRPTSRTSPERSLEGGLPRRGAPFLRKFRPCNGDCGVRPRLSTFPTDKPFERLEPDAPVSEVVLRLVVGFYSDAPVVVGTATILCRHLLVTARHVLTDRAVLAGARSVDPASPDAGTRVNRGLVAVQVLPGPEYVIWEVVSAIAHPASDLALLHVSSNPRRSDPESPLRRNAPVVNPFAPHVGDRVAAFGYRRSSARASRNSDSELNIVINDEFMSSVGVVREIHDSGRDRVMLPFPCYRVDARFDAGMSGGPLFDEYGSLCGLVCSNIEGSHRAGEPISYVTTLWPLFTLIVDGDRGDDYPRGVRYPAIELARDGQIHVSDRTGLLQWFNTHVDPNVPP